MAVAAISAAATTVPRVSVSTPPVSATPAMLGVMVTVAPAPAAGLDVVNVMPLILPLNRGVQVKRVAFAAVVRSIERPTACCPTFGGQATPIVTQTKLESTKATVPARGRAPALSVSATVWSSTM
jgi:hypothetical protein